MLRLWAMALWTPTFHLSKKEQMVWRPQLPLPQGLWPRLLRRHRLCPPLLLRQNLAMVVAFLKDIFVEYLQDLPFRIAGIFEKIDEDNVVELQAFQVWQLRNPLVPDCKFLSANVDTCCTLNPQSGRKVREVVFGVESPQM